LPVTYIEIIAEITWHGPIYRLEKGTDSDGGGCAGDQEGFVTIAWGKSEVKNEREVMTPNVSTHRISQLPRVS